MQLYVHIIVSVIYVKCTRSDKLLKRMDTVTLSVALTVILPIIHVEWME